jgi:hypothetical protein
MILFPLKAVLVELDDRGSAWISQCAAAALNAEGWQIHIIDQQSELPHATKHGFHAAFYWSDAEGHDRQMSTASHLAFQVGVANGAEEGCKIEQQALRVRLEHARGGSLNELGFFTTKKA